MIPRSRISLASVRAKRFMCEIATTLLDVLMASYHMTTLRGWPNEDDEDTYEDSPTVAKQRPGTQMRYLSRETGFYDVSLDQHRSGERPPRFFSSPENAEAAAEAANKSLSALRRGLIWGITLAVTVVLQVCNGGLIVTGQQSEVPAEANAPSMLPHMADTKGNVGQDQSDPGGTK